MKSAVLFIAHVVNESNLKKYRKLKCELSQCDVYWVFQSDSGRDCSKLHNTDINVFKFDMDKLNKLCYSPIYNKLYGSEHFIMEYFYQVYPQYDFYWGIEYDVVFTGNWNVLFNAYGSNNADLLSSHIEKYNEKNKDWVWWNMISFADEDIVEKDCLVKSFNPIYRISNRALNFLDTHLKKDYNGGFYEIIIATSLYNHGFTLEDFGGIGEFVSPENHNRFYIQNTDKSAEYESMRCGLDFSVEEIISFNQRNKLFHPLKNDFYE